jgi:hypothetical protein
MTPTLPARSAAERRAPGVAPLVVLTEVRRLPEEGRLRLT